MELSDDALRVIAGDYTREAGVRNLEREIGKLLRKVATAIAGGSLVAPVSVDASDMRTYVGTFHLAESIDEVLAHALEPIEPAEAAA